MVQSVKVAADCFDRIQITRSIFITFAHSIAIQPIDVIGAEIINVIGIDWRGVRQYGKDYEKKNCSNSD